MQHSSVTCKNCGNLFAGSYCNLCGEKVYHEHDKAFSHFIEEAFHFITHFDSKFFRSFWLIFSHPGFLAKEYCGGKRKNYFSPISLFMIGVVIYLLFPLLQGLNISFSNHISNTKFLHLYFLRDWALHKIAAEHISASQLAEKFNHLSPKVSKILLVILIPMSALILALLFRRKGKFFFDHLIMAAEFNSFYLYFTFMILPLLIFCFDKITGIPIDIGDNAIFLSVEVVAVLLVLTLALKTFYSTRLPLAFFKGLAFLLLNIVALIIYRLILFSVVMLFI